MERYAGITVKSKKTGSIFTDYVALIKTKSGYEPINESNFKKAIPKGYELISVKWCFSKDSGGINNMSKLYKLDETRAWILDQLHAGESGRKEIRKQAKEQRDNFETAKAMPVLYNRSVPGIDVVEYGHCVKLLESVFI